MSSASGSRNRLSWIAPAVVALIAFVAVVAAIDPAGDYPRTPEGPGLTVDETFNVQQGVRLVEGLRTWLLGVISWKEIFGDPRDLGPDAEFGYHNPDHPPLGRFWLGVWHNATATVAPPRSHDGPFITVCARVGSAAAFALTVFLCGLAASRWYGTPAGVIAALSLLLMPRVFGHAHLAALETCIGLAYLGAVLAVAWAWNGEAAPSNLRAALAGLALGAAMLTKIQGALLPIPIGLWALWQWRGRAVRPLVMWGLVGLATFYLFWPWLWFHPVDRLFEYLGRTTQRTVLYVWYFGERCADRDVPWHYPAVMFLTTIPAGLLALGGAGLLGGPTRAWRERRTQLVLAALAFPLVLFSIPGVAVYDGARLFLVVFPLWAILAGRGGAWAWTLLRRRWSPRVAGAIAACALAGQTWGLVATWPCYLSYYNVAVGGLRGADRLGLELDYWGEAVTRDLLRQVVRIVPAGAKIDAAPVLHEFQLPEMLEQSPVLRHRNVRLQAFGDPRNAPADYLLVFRRMADLSPELRETMARATPLAEIRREGVVLAGLYVRRKKSADASPPGVAPEATAPAVGR